MPRVGVVRQRGGLAWLMLPFQAMKTAASTPIFSLLFFGLALAGCGDGGGGAGGGGAGGSTGGGGATSTGGSTTTTTSEGGCPANVPDAGDTCGGPGECVYSVPKPGCGSNLDTIASCEEERWNVYRPLQCGAPDVLACNPLGSWNVATTGPYLAPDMGEASLFDSYTGFLVKVIQRENGRLYVNDWSGTVSEDGCALSVWRTFSEDCQTIDGQEFCSTIDGHLDLDLSLDPVTGTMHMTCWGECSDEGTAPVQATLQP